MSMSWINRGSNKAYQKEETVAEQNFVHPCSHVLPRVRSGKAKERIQ